MTYTIHTHADTNQFFLLTTTTDIYANGRKAPRTYVQNKIINR